MFKEICEQYFRLFSEQNIKELSELFSEDVILRDWENDARGKDQVVAVNQHIFDSVETIEVLPLAFYEEAFTVAAELEIIVNQTEKLLVVDIITFNESEKIVSVRAYQG